MTQIYLAAGGYDHVFEGWDWDAKPLGRLATFASKAELEGAYKLAAQAKRPASFMLDSGAFTAWNTGKVIDIDALILESKNPVWDVVVGLDVIGDADGSRKNADYMRERGCEAMPVFHLGEPWELLEYYCSKWAKVGLSYPAKMGSRSGVRWYGQCFARAWPHRFHAFGDLNQDALLRYPFHSADAATWILAPSRFQNLAVRRLGRMVQTHKMICHPSSAENVMRVWMDAYFDLQVKLQARWSTQLAKL